MVRAVPLSHLRVAGLLYSISTTFSQIQWLAKLACDISFNPILFDSIERQEYRGANPCVARPGCRALRLHPQHSLSRIQMGPGHSGCEAQSLAASTPGFMSLHKATLCGATELYWRLGLPAQENARPRRYVVTFFSSRGAAHF